MPLISCPECARQVSDRALVCPGCGYPIAPARSNASDLTRVAGIAGAAWAIPNIVRLLVGGAIAIAMFYFIFGGHR